MDFGELDRAAHDLAAAENAAIFHGWKAAGIAGIAEASPHKAIALGNDCERYPRHVAMAVEQLLAAGTILSVRPGARARWAHGLVLGEQRARRVLLLDHLRTILGGPLVWSPGVEARWSSAARRRLPVRVGEDISVGYLGHDADAVQLYLEESFSFRVATPEAAVA